MYKIERRINERRKAFDNLEDFYQFRYTERQLMQEHIEDLKELVFNPPATLLPQESISKVIMYTRKRWGKLIKFMDDGELEMDTNFVVNSIRPLVLSRKNYLFAGNQEVVHRMLMLQSRV